MMLMWMREAKAMKRAALAKRKEMEQEHARYMGALEEVLEQIGTSDALPPDLTLTAIENIADRALHPEGTE
jgi:hypothetical protein